MSKTIKLGIYYGKPLTWSRIGRIDGKNLYLCDSVMSGKDPGNPDERLWFYNKIKEIIDSPNRRIRKGQYHTEGECFLIYTEHYATIIKTDGEFVTFYSLKSKPLNPKRQAKAAIPLNEREWFKAMKKIE